MSLCVCAVLVGLSNSDGSHREAHNVQIDEGENGF